MQKMIKSTNTLHCTSLLLKCIPKCDFGAINVAWHNNHIIMINGCKIKLSIMNYELYDNTQYIDKITVL